ncbi:MAG: hypothetical protein DRI26_07550 [Chloroflexi bacterium]|nr:MAG: hypothetical protein DRI26_07550 [Chloroflexota bacterium]
MKKLRKAVASQFTLLTYYIPEANFSFYEVEQAEKPSGDEGIVVQYSLGLEPGEVTIEDINEKEGVILRGTMPATVKVRGRVGRKVVTKIDVSIVGIFLGKDMDRVTFEKFCKLNGLANLLMVVRAYISSTTSQMGRPPVVIPLVNLYKTLTEVRAEHQQKFRRKLRDEEGD